MNQALIISDDELRCEDFDQNNDKGDLMMSKSLRFSPIGPRINGVSPSANLMAKLLAKGKAGVPFNGAPAELWSWGLGSISVITPK